MITIVPYEETYKQEWDRFVQEDAVNGTFLQSRNFLNYHPKERFVDSSYLLFKDNKLAAVVPGCVIDDEGKKVFSSHPGSTYGGLVIHKKYYNASNVIDMIKTLENCLLDNRFTKILLKITPDLFCKEKSDLLQYAFTYCGYNSYSELSTYIDFEDYNDEIINNFSGRQKRNLKKSQQFPLVFRNIRTNSDICKLYEILKKNLIKYNAEPVHSIEELLDFKNNRLKQNVDFFAVFLNEKMISASMIFQFNSTIHTQYLAADYDYEECRPMVYLYYCLIDFAKTNGFKKLSWGISTEQQGAILNNSLLEFKEEFGSKYALNRGYLKKTPLFRFFLFWFYCNSSIPFIPCRRGGV